MTRYLLPWPPSVNHMYGERQGPGRRRYLKPEGEAFHKEVWAIVRVTKMDHDCNKPAQYALRLEFMPPDNRRRDSHNCEKIVIDALVKAGAMWDDCDSAIRRKTTLIGPLSVGGMVVVGVDNIGGAK